MRKFHLSLITLIKRNDFTRRMGGAVLTPRHSTRHTTRHSTASRKLQLDKSNVCNFNERTNKNIFSMKNSDSLNEFHLLHSS